MCNWMDALLDFWFPEPQRDKQADISTTHSDSAAYLAAQAISVDIPEFYLRHVPCEPCPSAIEEAERVVRR